MWRYLKSSPLAVTALVICVLMGALLFLFFVPLPESPEQVFRRRVADPIPMSIRNIRASGRVSLAGGSEMISFELSPEDFPKILARHKFVEKRPEDLHYREEDTKRFPTLEDPVYFQASDLHGLITFTIKTNPSRTVVYYRYTKI